MDDFPGNSRAAKRQETTPDAKPKQKAVVTSKVKARKKPLTRRITDTITADDTHSVGNYILFEVMLPAAKTMVSDAVSQGIERLLFGDSRKPVTGNRQSYTPYNRPTVRGYSHTTGSNPHASRYISDKARATHDFREVILDNRGEAEEVLERLSDLIRDYGNASVSDLYDLVGTTGSFTDDKWGWVDARGFGVRRVREGYLLELPRTVALD